MSKKKNKIIKDSVANETVQNGGGIGGGFNNPGFPGNQAAPYTQSISTDLDLYNNLRWYFISNERQFLSQMYVELSLVKTICDVPVDDALRGGVEISSKQLSEPQLEELSNSLDRDDNLNTVGQACKWNRLFGGAGIIILTDQDPETPLILEDITKDDKLEFRAVDMWELFWDKQNTQGYDVGLDREDFEFYDYYAVRIHKSRVMRLKGLTAPSFLRPRLRGWGFSVAEGLIRSLNQYIRATDVAYDVLNEFKVDIYKVKNLANTLMSPIGAQKVRERIAQTNYQKSYQNAIVMDTEDDYMQKQVSFAGLGDWMQQVRMQVAADMRMPMTKLFGISSAGFSSGEDDIEIYNSMVESEVRNKIKYDILRVCEIKCQQMFGFIPDDLSLQFKPLRVLSSEQEENVKTSKFNRLVTARQNGDLSEKEFKDACNRGNIFDIKFDTEDASLDGYMDDKIGDQGQDPYKTTDIDNPGANREDTKRTRATDIGGIPKGEEKSDSITLKRSSNSLEYDRVAYEHDGGDSWIDQRRLVFYDHPKDMGLWARVKAESQEIYGRENKSFMVWLYQKEGGSFSV